jgi:hypothetical protein
VKLRRHEWPTIIARLADAVVAAAKSVGVHGRVTVHENREGDAMYYVVAVRVPASETAMSRAMASPKTK